MNDEMVADLNLQYSHEIFNSQVYMTCSVWCFEQGLVNTGKFFKKQSDEELAHASKIANYMQESLTRFHPVQVEQPGYPTGLPVISQMFLEAESLNRANLLSLYDKANKMSDIETESFLQPMVDEQVEEMYTANLFAQAVRQSGTPLVFDLWVAVLL